MSWLLSRDATGSGPHRRGRASLTLAFEGASGSAGRTESTFTSTRQTWTTPGTMIVSQPDADSGWRRRRIMSTLPGRPDLDQLRHQARELLRAAAASDEEALRRIRVVSEKQTLSAAQLAIAREHGFPSWPKLRAEVLRRQAATRPDTGTEVDGRT